MCLSMAKLSPPRLVEGQILAPIGLGVHRFCGAGRGCGADRALMAGMKTSGAGGV